MLYDTCNYYMCQSIVNMYTPIPRRRPATPPAQCPRIPVGSRPCVKQTPKSMASWIACRGGKTSVPHFRQPMVLHITDDADNLRPTRIVESSLPDPLSDGVLIRRVGLFFHTKATVGPTAERQERETAV